MRARHESAEIEQFVGRLAGDGGAQTGEVDGEGAIFADEIANPCFAQRAKAASLRVGELRGERDPSRRTRCHDGVPLATRASGAARCSALFARAALDAVQSKKQRAFARAVVDGKRVAKAIGHLRHELPLALGLEGVSSLGPAFEELKLGVGELRRPAGARIPCRAPRPRALAA